MARPEHPYDPAPDGYAWTAVPAAPYWRIDEGRRCRANAGPGRTACGAPSVVAVNRGRNRYRPPYGRDDSWWAYCPEHMHGRWIEGGRVMHWVLRPAEEVGSGG